MENSFYTDKHRFFVAVDCIVLSIKDNKLSFLAIERNFEPEKGKLSLPGGFVEEEESLDSAACRILKDLTGLSGLYLEQVFTFGDPYRDPVGRTLSTAYYSLINIEGATNKISNAKWINIENIPKLVFDHNEMINKALESLRIRVTTDPVAFNMLGEHFTFPQFQNLYEEIFNLKLDKRNFRKKTEKEGFLEKLNKKDMTTSKRGAYLYKLKKENYKYFNIH